MFLDALLEFDAYTGVAITVTRDSTNILDMAAQRDMGAGDNSLSILCQITEAFVTADAAVLTVDVRGAKYNAGAPGTFYVLGQSPTALAAASLTIGRELLKMDLPLWSEAVSGDELNVPRYYKLVYTVTVGSFSAGKVASYLVPKFGRDTARSYPQNAGISNTYS